MAPVWTLLSVSIQIRNDSKTDIKELKFLCSLSFRTWPPFKFPEISKTWNQQTLALLFCSFNFAVFNVLLGRGYNCAWINRFYYKNIVFFLSSLLPPLGFRPEGEISRRHSSNSRILRKVLTVEIYSHTFNIEKISICLNSGREEWVGNDDVSILCARKYGMVRMT